MQLEDLRLHTSVISRDGHKLGTLSRFVFDTQSLRLTHIVVDTGILRSGESLWKGGWGLSHDRLVPIGAVKDATSDRVEITMSGDEFKDHSDACIGEAENYNDYQDGDGCPDTPPPPDSDGDGTPDASDPCPDNAADTCDDPVDSDGDGTPDASDPCPDDAADTCDDPVDGGDDAGPADADGDARETPIWIVVLDGAGWIRTNDSRWLANIRRGSPIELRAGEATLRVQAEEVDDPAQEERVEAAFKAKYGWMQRVISAFRMRRPTVLRLSALPGEG